MKNIMVLNLGSTSFKFKLFEMDGHEKLLAQGSIDAIGSGTSALVVKIGEDKTQKTVDCPNHDQAFRLCMNELKSILPDLKALSAIGYKAVSGRRKSAEHSRLRRNFSKRWKRSSRWLRRTIRCTST